MKKIYYFLRHDRSRIVFLTFLIIGLCAFTLFYYLGLLTAYTDAKAHLNIARRVFDNVTPGVSQLGGVWLPLLHLLMLPTIWIDFFWHTGLSGALVNIFSFAFSAVYLYKLIFLYCNNKYSAIGGLFILASNLNLLYMQSTAMTESLFIFTLITAVYYLIKWTKTRMLPDLLIASFFVFLCTINRYEGWAFSIACILVVLTISYFHNGRIVAESRLIIFGSIALLGIVFWLFWQLLIFGNPLYFLGSEFSSKGQTMVAIQAGEVPTYKNVAVSFLTNLYSLMHVLGLGALLLAVLGSASILSSLKHNSRSSNLIFFPITTLSAPFFFLCFAVYNGNVPINVPEISSSTLTFFNIRYALYSLPFVSILGALFVRGKKTLTLAVTLLIINTALLCGYGKYMIVTLADAKDSEIQEIGLTADWIRNNYTGGKIIVSAAVADGLMFESKLPLKVFITEGSGKFWRESTIDPDRYAETIILVESKRDMVQRFFLMKHIKNKFVLKKKHGQFSILVRRSGQTKQ